MAGNTYGELFRVTTYGESHGAALGGIIDGCPPRLPLTAAIIQRDLDRRRPGASRYVTQRREPDRVEILSGLFNNLTTGAPLGFIIYNQDAKSKDYSNLIDTYRPGHADYTYEKKYGIRDHRGGGRSSARETAARVAAGAVARALLAREGDIRVRGYLSQLDDIAVPFERWDDTEDNPFFTANRAYEPQLAQRIDELRRAGDSCGALLTIVAENIPPGLGAPVFDRLDADIGKAMLSINAVKGVEIGAGFAAAAMRGSQHNDLLGSNGFQSNHAGGILGGISSGQNIQVRIAVKPTASISRPQSSVRKDGSDTTIKISGRHDPCVGMRAVPVAEAMLCLTLADHLLRHRALTGGSDSSR